MNPLKALCVVAFLAAAVCAVPNQQQSQMSGKLKPSQWLSRNQLEQTPSVADITVKSLENMSLDEGAKVLETIYHVAQINNDLKQTYVPNPSSVPVYIVQANGQKVETTLDRLADTANQQADFGTEEITIFITGLPSSQSETVEKANRKLVESYMQRYNVQRQKTASFNYDNQNQAASSEEANADWETPRHTSGSLVIIALGEKLTDMKHIATLRIPEVGAIIGRQITKLNAPNDIIHIVGQSISAHVAGAAGQEYKRITGNKLERITALDPSKLYAKNPESLSGLARGDAKFVDAIHTSALGMGTLQRVGNVDFFPNGPSVGVPGSQNVVEASMRATRYFAESVRPGNGRNFPAVEANSLQSYKNNNGYGKRVYMGVDLATDLEGDYILEVNSHAPFGKRAPAQKQNSYHGVHKSWKKSQSNFE